MRKTALVFGVLALALGVLPSRADAAGYASVGVGISGGEIHKAFPVGVDIAAMGGPQLGSRVFLEVGAGVAILILKGAQATGSIVCTGASCSEDKESGFSFQPAAGMSVAVGRPNRVRIGGGVLYQLYSGRLNVDTDTRSGWGGYGRVAVDVADQIGVIMQFSRVSTSGERFGRRVAAKGIDNWFMFSLCFSTARR